MLVSTDKAFVQDTRSAFATSDVIQLVTVEKNVTELRGEIQEADCGAVIIDMDAARLEEIEALQRITRRLEGKAPVVVVTQEFNAAAVRILVQLQGRRLPGQAADDRRPRALLHPRAAGTGAARRIPNRRSTPSSPRRAASAPPRWRCRPRSSCTIR